MRPLSIIGRGCRWTVGAGDASRERWIVSSAFFDNPEAANDCEKIFELHSPDIWKPGMAHIRNRAVIAWSVPGWDSCEHLPTELLLAYYGPIFSSSISWMLAYALHLGYNDIELHGVDMKGRDEYEAQRDYLFFLMGIARGMHVDVKIPRYSGVYMAPEIYGVEAK